MAIQPFSVTTGLTVPSALVKLVFETVAAYHGVPLKDVKYSQKIAATAARREVTAIIATLRPCASLTALGAAILHSDHTTVAYALCRYAGMPSSRGQRDFSLWLKRFRADAGKIEARWREIYEAVQAQAMTPPPEVEEPPPPPPRRQTTGLIKMPLRVA